MATEYCPQCGTARVGALRFCRSCAFDYDSIPQAEVRAPSPPATPLGVSGPPFADSVAPVPPLPVAKAPSVGGAVRQGFGWATGCLVFLVVAIIVLAALAGLGRSSSTPVATDAPTAPAVAVTDTPLASLPATPLASPVVVTGNGTATSAPFHLVAGDYRSHFDLKVTDPNSPACASWGAYLEGDNYQDNAGQATKAGGRSGETFLYGVPDGNFHVSAIGTGCAWRITLTRQS